jgi:hypothetical protein
MLRLGLRSCGGWGGWHGDQLGHLAQVPSGGGEEERVFCAVGGGSPAQAAHPQDAFEVREQHIGHLRLLAET